MRPVIKYTLITLVVLVILFAFGPVVEINETIDSVVVPNDVEKFLHDEEHQFSDIRPGAEKTVIWNDPVRHSKTPVSIVYLHGFSATRQEVAPLCDQLAAMLGANLFYTRLTGHGRTSQAMDNVTVNALLNDAVQALEIGKKIGNNVILVGSSTGGTLATWLASRYNSKELKALILLSPNYGFRRADAELLLLPWGNMMANIFVGDTYHFTPINDAQAQYWTTSYSSQALLPMMGLVKLIRDSALDHIQTPTLVLYSRTDKLLDISAIKNTTAKFNSQTKQLVAIKDVGDPQQHILAGDTLSPQTTEQVKQVIMEFIKPLL